LLTLDAPPDRSAERSVIEPAEPASMAARAAPGRRIAAAWALLAGGLVAVLLGAVGLDEFGLETRIAIAIAGLAGLWRGVDRLGTGRYGSRFERGHQVARVWLCIIVGAAVFADLLPIEDWRTAKQTRDAISMSPGWRWPEPLGRTSNGYSQLSHIVYGARTSLTIALTAVVVGMLLGVAVGLFAGWHGGAVDGVIGVMTNSMLTIPPLILLLAIVAVYGSDKVTLSLALAVVSVPTYARLMRAQTIALRRREFVLAARAMGATNRRLMWREVLPNAVVPVLSYSSIVVAAMIVAEGSISYLGFGVPSPTPSWGGMVAAGQPKLKTNPHLVLVPAIVMCLTVLAFNRVGEHMRNRTSRERA
jgi:peptide/nickel transport system permease protein